MGKEEEVMQLLETIKGELALKVEESSIDPFKDLLHFIESPLDISTDDSHVNKIVELSDEDNFQCSQCKITFEKSTTLSFHMKKVHKSIAKGTEKKSTETNLSKDNQGMEAFSIEEVAGDGWAEMVGGLYQCLVCLASGLAWERRQVFLLL